jgi:anti-sigma regulatory factor (Ser/Thr protein kinase)
MGMLRVSLANQFGEIRRVNAALGDLLAEEGVPDRTIHHVRLVVEELVSNVVRYAFEDQSAHRIEVDVRTEPRRVVVTIEDDGRAFNPNEAPPPQLDQPLEKRRIGGLGIFLVKKLTSDLNYSRSNNRNRVRATVDIATK